MGNITFCVIFMCQVVIANSTDSENGDIRVHSIEVTRSVTLLIVKSEMVIGTGITS